MTWRSPSDRYGGPREFAVAGCGGADRQLYDTPENSQYPAVWLILSPLGKTPTALLLPVGVIVAVTLNLNPASEHIYRKVRENETATLKANCRDCRSWHVIH